jgi:hypothetical protein
MIIFFTELFRRNILLRISIFLALYVTLPLIWFLPSALDGSRTFFAFGDAVEQSYAWMHRIAQSLHQGFLPLWNPYSQGGTSFVGEIQSGVFYPVTLAFAWFFGSASGIDVFWLELWVICHFSIGLIGMHWLIREMRFSHWAAIASAICYAMLGPVLFRASGQVGILFGLMWLPYALAFSWRFYRGGSFWNAAGIGLIIAMQINAGHIQPAFHTIILIATLGLAVLYQSAQKWATLKRLSAGGIIAVLVLMICAGPQLYLGLQYLSNVYRWVGGDSSITSWERMPLKNFLTLYVMTPTALLSIVNPWQYSADDSNSIYIGVCLVALLGCALLDRKMEIFEGTEVYLYRKWLLLVGGAGLLISLGAYTLLPLGIYPLPLGTAVRSVGRYVILFHFAIAVFLAVAMDRFVISGKFVGLVNRIPRWVLVVFFLHALAWYLYKWSPMTKQLALELFVLSVGLLVLRIITSTRYSVPLAVFATIGSALFASWMVRGYAMPQVSSEQSVARKFEAGSVIAHIKSQLEPWRVIVDESAGLPKNIGVVAGIQTKFGHAATYYKPYFDFIMKDTALDSKVNDILGVRWVISRIEQPLPLVLHDDKSGLRLYERPSAWPRARLVSKNLSYSSPLANEQKIRWIKYYPNEIILEVTSVVECKLQISDIFYPGWNATVNGVEVNVMPSSEEFMNGTFREINIPPTTSTIVFRYSPLL